MKLAKSLTLLLAGLLTATALFACNQEATESGEDSDSTTAPSHVTTTAPVTTETPVTTPAVTDKPSTTPPVTEPTPDAPVDHSALTPSMIYDALLTAEGFSISIQAGPTQITCDKSGDLVYLHLWSDHDVIDDESYLDLSTDSEALQTALSTIDIRKDSYWLQDDSYNSFDAQYKSLTLKSHVMAEYNAELAQFSRNGTTYTYFVSDTDGESITITISFVIPTIQVA